MVCEILLTKKVLKNIEKMPAPVQKKLVNLIDDLRDRGPLRSEWPNYSKLGATIAILPISGSLAGSGGNSQSS